MFKLARHFSVMSALATAFITTILVGAYYAHELGNLRQLVEDRNVAQAYSFANAIWSRHSSHITDLAEDDGGVIRVMPQTAQLDQDLRQLTRGLPILKVKIFQTGGLTVYSSDPAQIGESKAQDKAFAGVLRSGLPATRWSFRGVLNSWQENFEERHVAETYVPIKDDGEQTRFVVELYTDITPYVAKLVQELRSVASLLVAALLALYVLLYVIVRRADGILKQQYSELQSFNARLEDRVAERTARLSNQQRVLSGIIKSDEFRRGDLVNAFGALTSTTAAAMGIGRVSVWLFNDARDHIRCVDLYQAEMRCHSSGVELPVAGYPAYFAALARDEVIAADDAVSDPRTREFAKSYLVPLSIGSMLDAPIVRDGRVDGVVCCERIGAPVRWTAEQRLLAIAIASLASLVIERTERMRAEEDLKAATQRVEAANRAKSLFLANMSHEIRTPMNGVFGMTDLLLRTELSERQRRFVSTISQSARSLLTIINDVLDLSRIEAGKLELDAHDFPLRTTVEDTIDLLAEEAERKGLELNLFIAASVPDMVVGDSGRLRQILTNLVSNAIKFTRSGEVTTSVTCTGAEHGTAAVKVEVRDTGIGIPGEIQRRLFQPFQQADTSITRRFGGAGLGLSISKHLVELMGGTIELDSAPGAGTRITFTLQMALAARAPARPRPDQLQLAGKRVLVVDDRETNREIITTYFAEAHADATALASAEEALVLMRRAAEEGRPFDLAIIDMVLPGMNGLELGRRIKADPALESVRMLMLTSMSWKGDIAMARELGFEAFLTKPVHRAQLVQLAISMLGEQSQRRDEEHAGGAEPEQRPSLGLTVLVAEDNPVNMEVAREFLTALGCTVVAAENGAVAMAAMSDAQIDVVLMDCQMPEMDGITAARLIRDRESRQGLDRVPIIAVTANAFAEDREACIAAGMDDYMSKPFREDQLVELLTRWSKSQAPGCRRAQDASCPPAAAEPSQGGLEAPDTASEAARYPSLDTRLIGQLSLTRPALLGRMIEAFLAFAPKAVLQLMAAVSAQDADAVRAIAHSLKSSSANLGATRLSELCRALEERMRAGGPWDPATCVETLSEIEIELLRITSELEKASAGTARAGEPPSDKASSA